ncbi:hypothetical protein KCU64_g10174, partial [Aureobasidium melanogenum]
MEIVPISSLSPSSALPTDCGFKALVTLLWPFSSTTGQCALLLADPDARQRYQKGQVRVRFVGPSARYIAASGIGIGDSVQVALVGAQWLTEADTALVKTPGRSVDGELVFKNRLYMTITRGQTEPRTIDVDESTEHTSPKPSMLPPSTPIARSKPRTSFDAYGVAVYSSPAFMKRLRLSEGGTPYSPVPVSEADDQDTVASRKRRRVSYKNVSEWKFDAREPSPEKDQIDVLDDADGDEDLVAGAAVPEKTTVENGNLTEHGQDLDMQDAVEPTEDANHQAEQHASETRSIQGNTIHSAQETVVQDQSVEIAEDGRLQNKAEAGASLNSAAESSNAKESEERVVEAVFQQPAEATRSEQTSPAGALQALESSMTSQFQILTSQDMPSSALPRLTILPTESELLEQMARARTIGRPTTPILQPLLTEALPLPSPFPTSAQKIPSPVIPNIAGTSQITENKTVLEDAAETAAHTRNVDEIPQEMAPASESQTRISQQGSGQQIEATSQTPRVVADTYDGYAEENPVVLSSSSENEDDGDDDDDDEEEEEEEEEKGEAGSFSRLSAAASLPVVADDQVGWRSRGDRFDDESSVDEESDEDMESSGEDSESDDVSSAYNSEQIIALQEQSDDEGAVEEPDWDYLERKLEQEEAALQQSREDLTARDGGPIEAADDLEEGDEADAVMHDDNSELDEEMLARSDDDSADDDSDGTGYFDQVILPDTEYESGAESEIDEMDQSYQPSMPENSMYSHPFGLDGARLLTETRTALPSQAASEAGSAVGDETVAWRDRDAAVEALDQQMQRSQRQLQTTEQAVQAPPAQHVPPPSSSRLDVVELLDDSDSDEEDAENVVPVAQESIDFLPSIGLVNHLLSNNHKDANLELSGSVTAQIRSELKKISDQVDSQSSLTTKFNALRAICKIGVNVTVAAESGNMFAESVKYRLKEDEVLVSVCWRIYNQLSIVDRYHTGQPSDVLVALEELEEKRDYCFQGFAEFLKHFKQNYHHMPLEMEQQQIRQHFAHTLPRVETQHAQEVESHLAVKNKDSEQSSAPQVFETQRDPISTASTDNRGQNLSSAVKGYTEQRTEAPEQSQIEPEPSEQADVDTTLSSTSPAQVAPAPADVVSSSQVSSMEKDIEPQNEIDANESEMMEVEAESHGPTDEHEIDPALLEGEHEIDPALLEQADSADYSRPKGYEIDPALLQEEHEIDPALLVEGHVDIQSNSHSSPLQIDDAMSETSEPATFSVAKEEESEQRNVEEEATAVATETVKDEPSAPQDDGAAIAQVHEVPLEFEVQQSVETDLDTVEQMEVDTTPLQASLETTARIKNSPKVKEDLRPLSSSSFKTLSPTPDAVQVQPPEPNARSTTQKTPDTATHMLDQPIEELDLSQVEPSWTSRFSQFSQSRSSRAHTRSETIPDSADEEATDLEAENNDTPDRRTGAEPATQATPPQGIQRATIIQPSQELGTALSQFQNPRHGASEVQSQLAAIEETTLPEDKDVAEEMRLQAGLDDELLADYVQVAPESEAVSALSPPRSGPSTPLSTKKPARPLTLFRGRKSIGSRVSIGGDEQGTRDTEQQNQDNQQQVLQDEVMQDLSVRKSQVSAMIEKVTEATTEGEGQSQDGIGASLASASSAISEPQPQKAQEVTKTTNATVATESEVSTAIEQAPEVEQASSNFQIKPTLKPFAEVEASLFGTPVKDKTAKPQEPQSAPSQSWRNALSSRMSEVPVIGSWFTPRRTTEVQKAATEHKATTSSTSFVEDTPTKAAAMPQAKQSSREREKSISPPPLQRYASQGTSTSLSYFTPLAGLHQHLNQQSSLIDIVAVCTTATSTAERAKSGPKDYYTTFRVIDQPLREYHTASQDEGAKDVKVEIFRPFKQSLPTASPGDVVLLRGFVVRSRNHKNYLLSTAASGWCVWRYGAPSSFALDYEGQEEEDDRPMWARKGTSQRVGEDGVREEVTGPPVEIGDEEREKVAMVRTWWEGLQKESNDKEEEGHDIIMID